MRKLLLAGVALGVVPVCLSATSARADDAVFPVTTETTLAGVNGPQLNGAAPGSVQVNLGGRMYGSVWLQTSPPGVPNQNKNTVPQFGNFFFLYPGFDYSSPGGVHFGAQAEIRDDQATYGNPGGDTPFFHQAWGYVSSASFGKFQFGTPASALTELAVGTSDDFGTGMFFAYYGTTPYIPWVAGDAYDNYNFMQKVTYTTPVFGGLTAAISYQPSAVALTDSYSQTNGGLPPDYTAGILSRNRVEIAAKYEGTFGIIAAKANVAYVFADATPTPVGGTGGQKVSFGNAGVELHMAGFELEGWVTAGKYSFDTTDGGNPMGPLPDGARGTTAFAVAGGYSVGPIKFGGIWYNVSYDQSDFSDFTTGVSPAAPGNMNGFGVGATYTVGPGVTVSLDAITATIQEPMSVTGYSHDRVRASGLGLSTFFSW